MTLHPQSVVGIDQGTTATKAYRLGADGGFQQLCSIEHRQIYPQPGWVEHNPRELLASGGLPDRAGGAVQAPTIRARRSSRGAAAAAGI
jgi:glycerol kinase